MRRSPGSLRIVATTEEERIADLARACREALEGDGSVGLIAADDRLPALREALAAEGVEAPPIGEVGLDGARLVAVPASLAKGLEFDAVVVSEPAEIVEAEERGANRLYVVLTRAVGSLHVVHARPLPEQLA